MRVRHQNSWHLGAAALAAYCLAGAGAPANVAAAADAAAPSCPGNDTGLSLPPGFCASIFADGIGHARHLVVSGDNVVYVNTWSGRYFGNDVPHAGGFLVALKDTTGTGAADVNQRFGETVQSGGAGGTGIAIYKDWLYAELNDKILKYPLLKGSVLPGDKSQVVVSGLPLSGDHPMHPFMIDAHGGLFIDAKYCSVLRRINVQSDHVGGLGLEMRIVAGHVAFQSIRAHIGLRQNPLNGVLAHVKLRRQLPA